MALPADPCQWLVWPWIRARWKGLESKLQHVSTTPGITTPFADLSAAMLCADTHLWPSL